MSERERWIVYPLLFFALGAALRDKFTHEVRTDQLLAGKIACEELLILDPSKPSDEGQRRVVAQLSSNAPQGRNSSGGHYGQLILIGSQGEELCGVNNDQLVISQIRCNQAFSQAFTVVDPQNPRQPLAVMRAVDVTRADGRASRVGSLLLTDDQGKSLFGLAEDQLQMRQIITEGVVVVDPDNPRRILAGLGSLAVKPAGPNAKPQRFGVLALNNDKYSRIVGVPLSAEQRRAAQQSGPATSSPGDPDQQSEPSTRADGAEPSGDAPDHGTDSDADGPAASAPEAAILEGASEPPSAAN